MRIFSVVQVVVAKISDSPLTLHIQALGMTATSGWTNPRLDNSEDPNPQDAVLEFSFEADRPTGPALQVLTPIMASVDVKPKNGADAVVVNARTNSITVHAAEFITPPEAGKGLTTLMVGEEHPPTTLPAIEEHPTTFALGEEHPPTTLPLIEEHPTTFAVGEEGPTTLFPGEEGATTHLFGEENPTTQRFGEEGPHTDPRLDDPALPRGGFTTQVMGEEMTPGGGFGPFGGL